MTPDTPRAGPPAPDADRTEDRGVSPVAGRFSGRRSRMITLAAFAVGCGAFLAATWDRGEDAPREASTSDTPPRQLTPFEPARRDGPRLAEAETDPDAPRLSEAETIPAIASETAPERNGPAPAETRQALADSARRAPVLAYSRGSNVGASPAIAPTGVIAATDPTPLDALRQAGPIDRATAGRLPDRNFLITAGATIPCVLQTAMDSTTPGYVACVLPRDVYSDNGAVVLLERGSRVLGEYRGGLQQGRRRLFVLWTRAVSPEGVTVALASPAADALGRAGFDGTIDGRFWDRFGGALLLSLVDDGAYAALGSQDTFRSIARAPSDAAAVALQGSLDIPPTLRKAQGSEVSIFVAQDLDFRSVYDLGIRP
nr:type IV secretion system protein VirB10 [uncultured Brevundimonas sp.]